MTSNAQRLTVALMTDALAGMGSYQETIWNSIAKMAADLNVNLIVIAGGSLNRTGDFQYDKYKNISFHLVNKSAVDGILLCGAVMSNYITPQELSDFALQFGVPVVSVGGAYPGLKSVNVDNEIGMYEICSHMLRFHGYKKPAFLRGPENSDDAIQRFNVFKRALKDNDLAFDPDYTYVGNFVHDSGYAAVRHWLDVKKIKPDCIIAANDNMAIGALRELQRRGVKVPLEVAVTGFDNGEECMSTTPSLSTVSQPIDRQAQAAFRYLVDSIRSQSSPQLPVLPTNVVLRLSCGCEPSAVANVKVDASLWTDYETLSKEQKIETWESGVAEHLNLSLSPLGKKTLHHLIVGLHSEIEESRKGAFLATMNYNVSQILKENENLETWQHVITVIRALTLSHPNALYSHLEDLWQSARVMFTSLVTQENVRQKMMKEDMFKRINAMNLELGNSFEMNNVYRILHHQLPLFKIPSFFLSFFEGEGYPPRQSRLVMGYNPQGALSIPEDGQLYATQELFPDRSLKEHRFTVALEPLYFQDEVLGYIGVEVGPLDGFLYESLCTQLSSIIKGSRLLRESAQQQSLLQNRNRQIQELAKPMAEAVAKVVRVVQEKRISFETLATVMSTSSQNMNKANQMIDKVSTAMAKMREIVESINDISEVVNILGLNAAIESAKAGNAGRGFSVIAGEIRKLSDTTNRNAKEISTTLKLVMEDTAVSVRTNKESYESFLHLEKGVAEMLETLEAITHEMETLSNNNEQLKSVLEA